MVATGQWATFRTRIRRLRSSPHRSKISPSRMCPGPPESINLRILGAVEQLYTILRVSLPLEGRRAIRTIEKFSSPIWRRIRTTAATTATTASIMQTPWPSAPLQAAQTPPVRCDERRAPTSSRAAVTSQSATPVRPEAKTFPATRLAEASSLPGASHQTCSTQGTVRTHMNSYSSLLALAAAESRTALRM